MVETSRYRITGTVFLPSEGYRSRVSDFLNAPERRFLPMTNVEVVPLDGVGEAQHHSFLALSVSHVVLVIPGNSPAGAA